MRPKILLIRFSSIGDIVLTTPVIRVLHQQIGAEVHLLTKKSFAGVLGINPYLEHIWTLDGALGPLIQKLQADQFTAIVDLHSNLRSLRVKLGLWRVPAYTFEKLNWQKWLLTRWKVNRMPDVHIVDRYLAAAAPLGVKNDGRGLDLFIPAEDEVNPLALGLPARFLALVVGAAHATKRMPIDQLMRFCKQAKLPIAVLGGPSDESVGRALAEVFPEQVVNLCGQLRLLQSADVLRQATLVVTHDTGLMHMAAALHKPVISIWGNTVPEFGMYPYLPSSKGLNVQVGVDDLPCRPCSKIGYAECPKGHFRCMQDQDIPFLVRQVYDAWRER